MNQTSTDYSPFSPREAQYTAFSGIAKSDISQSAVELKTFSYSMKIEFSELELFEELGRGCKNLSHC